VRLVILLLTISIAVASNAGAGLFVDEAGNFYRDGPGEGRVFVPGRGTRAGLPSTPLWDVIVDTTGSVTRLYVCAGLAFASQHGGVYVSDTDGVDWDSLSGAFANDFVLSVAQNRTDTQVLLAGTDGDGVYRTTDGGANWSPVLGAQKTRHIVLDKSNPSIIYCGNEGTGIFKSTDGGDSWFSSNAGMSLVNAVGIGVDGLDSNHIYVIWQALNSGGVFFTSDGGNTWTPAPSLPSQRQTGVAVDPTDGNVAYVCNSGPWNAGMDDGVFKSTDGGGTWENNWAFTDTAELEAVAVAPSSPEIVYTGGNKWLQPFGTRIWKSTDAGASWALVYDNPDKQFVSVVTIAIDPTDPQVVYAGTRANGTTVLGILKTTDGGATWAETNSGLGNLSVLSVAVDPVESSRVLAATAGGVFISADSGASWNPTDSLGYTRSVAVRPDSIMYAGTLSDGVYRSADLGGSWLPFSAGISSITAINNIAIDPSNPHRVHAALSNTGAYAVIDTGTAVWRAIGPFGGDVNWIEIAEANNQVLFAGTQAGVFKSTDGGAFWEKCSGGVSGNVNVMRASLTGDTIYAGATGLYRSSDGGVSWSEVVLPTEPYDAVTALSADPYVPGTMYLGLGSYLSGSYCHVLKSTDAGTTWEFKCGGLPFANSMEVSSIGINPMNTLKLYATFGSGFFGTSDFYVSLDGGEIWTHPVGVTELERASPRVPGTRMFIRSSPARNRISVWIDCPVESDPSGGAKLDVHDSAGRLMGSVDISRNFSGQVTFPAELTSGIYFVRLNMGGETITGKVVLVR